MCKCLVKSMAKDPCVNKLHEVEKEINLANLPDEVLLMIFSFLSKSDLVSLSQTCQSLKHVAHDPSLWTELILKYEAIRASTWACRELVSRCTMLKHMTITSARTLARPDIDSDRVMSIVLIRKDTLTYLKIDDGKGLHNSAMTRLIEMTNLRHLEMSAWRLESSGLLILTNLTELEEFLIRPCMHTCRCKISLPITTIKHFASRMKKLRILKIPDLHITQLSALGKRRKGTLKTFEKLFEGWL